MKQNHWILKLVILLCFFLTTLSQASLAKEKNENDEKNPWLAAGMSLILPGSGQIYVEENFWPEILISVGVLSTAALFFFVDHQRAQSIRPREIGSQTEKTADAYLDALTLILQIAAPSLWLWNAGDAYNRAESSNEKVIRELERFGKAYIIEENLVSVTLWQF